MSMISPGQTIGIMGGGQLGRMMAMEAHRMGYRVGVMDPQKNCPAAQVADFHLQSDFRRKQDILDFSQQVDVITIETELIPSNLLGEIDTLQMAYPTSEHLAVFQDRLKQRQLLRSQGIPQTAFGGITTLSELQSVGELVGFPGILKTSRSGYDGKGQIRVENSDSLSEAWKAMKEVPSVLEALVPLHKELSVILARGRSGEIQVFPVAENVHRNNILHATKVPADVPTHIQEQAVGIASTLAETLNYRGILAIEFFLLADETLLVNEVAPRPHNTGHFSFGGCVTSQFEQHVRAICGLPLGVPSLLKPTVMINLLGNLWENGSPPWDRLLSHPNVQLHLYGKDTPRPNRKMGHFLLFPDEGKDPFAQAELLLQEILPKKSQVSCSTP